jgi:hypothetical protein
VRACERRVRQGTRNDHGRRRRAGNQIGRKGGAAVLAPAPPSNGQTAGLSDQALLSSCLFGPERSDRDQIGRMDPRVGEVEPAGVADRVA